MAEGDGSAPSSPPDVPTEPSWKAALAAMTSRAGASRPEDRERFTPLGLLLEVREIGALRDRWRGAGAKPADASTPHSSDVRLAARPVVLSSTGNWVRGTVGWGNVGHSAERNRLDPDQQSWLAQIAAVDRSSRAAFGVTEPDWIYLDHVATPLLWNLLGSAEETGVAIVTGKRGLPVRVAAQATLGVDVTASGGDLHVTPSVRIDGDSWAAGTTRLIGDHGLYSWVFDPHPRLALAPTGSPITAEQRQLLRNPATVVVPRADAPEFLAGYLPRLRRTLPVTSPDGSVELPPVPTPTLVLAATHSAGHRLRLEWHWEYGTDRTPVAGDSADASAMYRDPAAEAGILRSAADVLGVIRPQTPVTLHGIDAAEFTEHVLPALQTVPGVRAESTGDAPDYRELTGVPELVLTTVPTEQRDWFDLGVLVTVDGKDVPFGPLFTALAKGSNKLLLVDGSYLNLRQPVFERLRDLIAEASEMDEWEAGLRISRYQASLWAEFEDLADETREAVAWREQVAGLLSFDGTGELEEEPPPPGIRADLRPYQSVGHTWLTFLWRHRLGGILADDMGLGKTLQALALIASAQEATAPGERLPFLVVAPTSVVSNWLMEAERFAPTLRVAGITETTRKSRVPTAVAAEEADLVITSYALFRLDFPEFQTVRWAGLILDEAQFAKNPASQAHENAVALDTPFKLAITGTPMENSLTDLWALLRIVAPGLFPSARRFREDYIRPIAAGNGVERLARLRRRIRPLVLRRTKELVASELPEKQEQVLEVDLAPEHRRLYDRFLQRERQKLLGLLKDMNRNRFIVFRSLTLLRLLSLDASLVDPQYAGVPSAKLDALLEHLGDVVAEGHRALVFSQFTSFLGKAADRLTAAGVPFAYLDGSTTRRGDVVKSFREGDAPVFLISLKAGGFGLNLTEADYVFLLDPWWNPAAEAQAVDRAHRIGQTRRVNVYRMVASGTIEQKVMALKEQKSRLFDAVIDDEALFSSALTAEEVRGLLDD